MEGIDKVFEQCKALLSDRQGQWHETYLQMPGVLRALNHDHNANLTPQEWCADMAALKLKRFYESNCQSMDSLYDCINYLALAATRLQENEELRRVLNPNYDKEGKHE